MAACGVPAAPGQPSRITADGARARTDGFRSMAVVLGVVGWWLGLPGGRLDRRRPHLSERLRAIARVIESAAKLDLA